ncbi:UDP-glucosyltransferase family protein [Medicago truncatula]|uniref:UDP-glucosyltransferase family protein n=1 Tax=Medicago truncatula TaxID=3880 RepID=G7KLS3_MEDTR|nr:UDP-glucosyltransferase family protein [Medicago truncatula]
MRGPKAFDGFTNFSFETIPDGLTPTEGDGDVTQDIPSLSQSIRKNFLQPFGELLAKLRDSATAGLVPPVTCLVADFLMSFTIQAAEEHALPIILFCPASACSFLVALHFRTLIEKGLIPLKDESYLTNGYLDIKLDCIPGLQNFRLKDLTDFIRSTNPNDVMVEFAIEAADRFHKASAIVFNTYDELESDVMNALYSMFPSLYTIGPLPSLLNQTPHNHLESLGSNLWKEDTKCLEWLESKEPGSVVYVNFGSVTVMTPEQLLEIAWGLANCRKPFLWIIRPDLVIGEQVLNHPSIGGFLTHCGWNSTIESIWEIGIEIDTNVRREEVEKLINELMVGEKGDKMRQKARELKAEENTNPGGCSYMNLDKVIKEVLLKQY